MQKPRGEVTDVHKYNFYVGQPTQVVGL